MAKIHTRTKRKQDLCSTHRHIASLRGLPRKKRPKTFSTENAALDWMKQQKLSEKDYRIEKVKKEKRFGIKKIL